MMQHIAVVRPEIAASSVEVGKVDAKPSQREGFSRHLQQQHDGQRSHAEHNYAAEQRRVEADRKVTNREQVKSAGGTEKKDSHVDSHTNQGSKPKENTRSEQGEQTTRPVPTDDAAAKRRTESTDADTPHKSDGVDNAKQAEGNTEAGLVGDKSAQADEKHDNEDKQAQDWLALVHKLVTDAQATESAADGDDGTQAIPANDASEQTAQPLSDKHRALLEQLGLDAEKVLQQVEAAGKLDELQALLRETDKAGELTMEQVFALLITDEQAQGDPGSPIAQNHALGMKPETEATQQSDPHTQRIQDYQQQQDKLSQEDKDLIALLRHIGDGQQTKEQQVQGHTVIESISTGDKVQQSDNKPKEGIKAINNLQQLAQLPEPALDKALQNLAERLPVKEAEPAVINQFIDNLKAGIEEFKLQRQQGREPGLDLQSLVSRSLGSEMEPQSNQQQSVLQAVRHFSEAMSLASTSTARNDAVSAFTVIGERLAGHETHVASESAKSAPAAVMDRAVNIARPEAAGQLAERVRMLVNQGNMSADIRLDPPDLGSMQIRISMNGEQASVNFVVQSQQARDMLDQAVPRLRDMLAERGIELGQSSVEQQQRDNKSGDSEGQGQMASHPADEELTETQSEAKGQDVKVVNGALGGIDYFV